ncbi:MAG: hypothetical protein G01um101430_249 [Parcubacteria group bacterium Gr01-1014_30]|nr:MAG: hypothetical protein G01um101430_249 [Parcubacteria group bacterium Gr01-1014_30]
MMSLREIALAEFKVVFDWLVESLPHTSSRELVVGQLTEVFERQKAVIGQVCDETEKRLRTYQEKEFAVFKEVFVAFSNRFTMDVLHIIAQGVMVDSQSTKLDSTAAPQH